MSVSSRSQASLAESIVANTYDAKLSDQLDVLLLWVTQSSESSDDVMSAAFAQLGVDKARATELTIRYIDRFIVSRSDDSYRVLGLGHSVSSDKAKKRYQRLIRVFHPDKNRVNDARFLSSRTERLNRAFDHIASGKAKLPTSSAKTSARPSARPSVKATAPVQPGASPPAARSTSVRRSPRHHSATPSKVEVSQWLVSVFGNSRKLKKLALISFTLIALILMGLIYLSP